MRTTWLGVGLTLIVGLWPLVYVLPLAPLSRDEVVWITRSAVSEPGWWKWVLASSHFVGYRPVTALSYSLDSLVPGWSIVPYRATDLLLHLAAAGLVYGVYRRLVPRLSAWGGVAAVGLFVAHPVAGVVVPHLARRSYALATVLSLLALWTLLGPARLDRTGRGREVGWLAATLAAMLANEAAVVLVPVSALAAWLHGGRRAAARAIGLGLAGAAVVLGIRLAVVGGLGGYDVDRGARWGAIFASTWEGLLGLTVLRSGSPPVPDLLAAVVVVLTLAGLALPLAARRGVPDATAHVSVAPPAHPSGTAPGAPAHGSLVAWVWLAGLAAAFVPQGVFFPRQVYLAVPALALLVGIALAEALRSRGPTPELRVGSTEGGSSPTGATTGAGPEPASARSAAGLRPASGGAERARRAGMLGAVALAAVGVGWQSPVLRGPDPVQAACWRANDRLVEEMAADLAEVPPRTPVHVVIPYYRRPQMEALRAREGDDERMVGRQTLTWLSASHGIRFGKSVLVLTDAGSDGPAATLGEAAPGDEAGGPQVILSPGSEVAQASDGWRVETQDERTVVIPEFATEAGFLYFHDGLDGRLIAPGGAR